MFTVDSFADQAFAGNPAAVCLDVTKHVSSALCCLEHHLEKYHLSIMCIVFSPYNMQWVYKKDGVV